MTISREQREQLLNVRELRSIPIFDLRADDDSDEIELTGYASTFQQYPMYGGPAAGGWIEQIDPKAFTKTLREKPDLMLLINHEGMPLARTKSGTLKLSVDSHGLKVNAKLDRADPEVQALEVKMRRSDMDEMSFAFRVKSQTWSQHPDFADDPQSLRTINEVSLHMGDVSVVNYGANPTTSAQLRSVPLPDALASARDRRGMPAAPQHREGATQMEQRLAQLEQRRLDVWTRRADLTDKVLLEQRGTLTADEQTEFDALTAQLTQLDERIAEQRNMIERSGRGNAGAEAVAWANAKRDNGAGSAWAQRAARAILGDGETRAVNSGNIDLPTLVESTVEPMPRPQRLIDLLVSRKQITSPAYQYVRQTTRTNNAATVPDYGTKPTTVLRGTPIDDRVRVVAHLSEDVPVRYWEDHPEVIEWLDSEMVDGVLDALEFQVISGDGVGENMEGLLTVAGTTPVAYTTDVPTTLRKAVTALQVKGVQPSAWVLNPADAEAIDLLRYNWGGAAAAPAGYLLDGFQTGTAGSGNVFGGSDIQRVVSNSVPAGTAVLGDWSKLRLYIRQGTTLLVDFAGDNFTNNTGRIRAEGRFGVGHLMPSAFAKVDLTP